LKKITWDQQKNKWLVAECNLNFEEVLKYLESNKRRVFIKHPTRHNQNLLILIIDNYTHVVPFVENIDHIFLKTIIPSRKYHKKYFSFLSQNDPEK
jgi:uncharacterized DUF497 family protein